MIKAESKNGGVGLRFGGTEEEISVELVHVIVYGCKAMSAMNGEDSNADIEAGFFSTVLTALDIFRDEGIEIDREKLAEGIRFSGKVNVSEIIDKLTALFGAITGEDSNGNGKGDAGSARV